MPLEAVSLTAGAPRGGKTQSSGHCFVAFYSNKVEGLSVYNILGSVHSAKDIVMSRLGAKAVGAPLGESGFAPPGRPWAHLQILEAESLTNSGTHAKFTNDLAYYFKGGKAL
jgi:hypothetical protein